MMENTELYDSFRAVPENAKRSINAGRLKGKTDINPMWRIKALTERFGPCGIGWKYEITNQALQNGANGEIAAFVDIRLSYKVDDVWSEPVYGVGGSMFVAKGRNGLYPSNECFKMALTDAISVAAKALGIGADVYWQADATKYRHRRPFRNAKCAAVTLLPISWETESCTPRTKSQGPPRSRRDSKSVPIA